MSSQNGENPAIYEFDGYRLDVAKRLVFGADGKPLPLKAKAFETLLYLVENPGRVIERDEIMEAVWPDTVVEENNLTQHISSLRRLFGETKDHPRFVVTVPGHGYKFAAEVKTLDPAKGRNSATPESDKTVPASRKWFIVLAAGVVVSLLVLGFLYRYETEPAGNRSIKSIAVLPFKPITEQNRDPSLEMGMTDALITKLAGSDGLSVRPFSAVRRFGSLEQDVVEAGLSLGVDAVLDGYMQISEDRVRISINLISVRDSKQVWGQPFEENLSDIFAAQEAIAERVANTLRVKLSENAKKRYTDNVEAYRLYLDGRISLVKLAPADVKRALVSFQKATEIDPHYALAYTGISDCYRSLVLSGEHPPAETIKFAVEAGEKAARIDPGLVEAQTNLGFNYFWYKRDWAAAEAAFKRALDIDPNSALAHHHYAHLLSNLGRHDEAIAEAEKVRKLDSSTPFFLTIQGLVYHQAGKLDEGIARFNEATKLDPTLWLPRNFAAIAYTDLKRYDEAIAAARKATELNPSQSMSTAYESVILARLGRREEARKLLDSLLQRSAERYVPPYHIAIACIGVGDRENALLWLEKSFSEQDTKIVFLKADHIWDELRTEPRFVELMRKLDFNRKSSFKWKEIETQ